jgi:hypothetical protein
MALKEFDTHHIMPRSKGGSNDEKNLVRLTRRQHINLHGVFMNMTPVEQIIRILDISSTALREEFKEDVAKILSLEPEFIYENGVLKPKR